MMMIMIWETKEDVKSKTMAYHRKMKPIKLNGRKPGKIIIHDSDNTEANHRNILKLISHDGLVLTNSGKLVRDGRSKVA